jgi:hypothetical protein
VVSETASGADLRGAELEIMVLQPDSPGSNKNIINIHERFFVIFPQSREQ